VGKQSDKVNYGQKYTQGGKNASYNQRSIEREELSKSLKTAIPEGKEEYTRLNGYRHDCK
jgi:hypothetical protein